MSERDWSIRRNLLLFGLVVLVAAGFFYSGLASEPFFADESAHIAQTYYYRLAATGRLDHVDWLHPAAYDHPPVYKYVIGLWLHLAGYQSERSLSAMEQWYLGNFDPPNDPGVLRAARMPMLWSAAIGCGLAYLLGRLLVGVKTGLLAAVLLAASPLYVMHARRAMADDLTQALVLAGLAAFVVVARLASRPAMSWPTYLLAIVTGGIACGLAPATKLNGAVAGLTIAVVTLASVIALLAFGRDRSTSTRAVLQLTGGTLAMGLIAIVVFVGVNPFLYATPDLSADQTVAAVRQWSWPPDVASPARGEQVAQLASRGPIARVRLLLDYRRAALDEGPKIFPQDALPTIGDRIVAIFVQGMGRWWAGGIGPPSVDPAAPGEPPIHRRVGLQLGISPGVWFIVPATLVLIGLWIAWNDGRARVSLGEVPVSWLLIAWIAVEATLLAQNLTLDWDRYYLGIVTITSVTVAYAVAGLWHAIRNRLVLTPPTRGTGSE